MREQDVFKRDIEVPEIVQHKIKDALTQIQTEGTEDMKTKQNKHFFKHQAAVIAAVCLLTATGITAAAAAHYFWSRGMKGTIQATDEQQQALTEQGIATNLEQQEKTDIEAVTDGGITIKPMETIVDGHFAYLSFSIEGYEFPEGDHPSFGEIEAYLGDNSADENGWLNMNGAFYGGIVSDENGNPVYDDGSALEFTENGEIKYRYFTEDGNLEFVMMVYRDQNRSLIGETLHVGFENLGIGQKADCMEQINGKWEFDIPLSGQSAGVEYKIGEKLNDTGFMVDSVEISPVSVKVNYSVIGNGEMNEADADGVPDFWGVIFKDGTRLNYLANGGMGGYTDESMQSAFDMKTFERVIDVEQVQAVLLRIAGQEQIYEVELPVQ